MPAPFYVWDPIQHAGFPADLEQAEYSAIEAPRDSEISPKVEAWIEAVKAFVLSDTNKPYMADNVIYDVNHLHARVVLEIEQMHIEGGEYFYKFLVESIRSHHLAAYDSYRGLFICSEYTLPAHAAQQLEQQFASVIHPAQESIDIDRLPTSEKQFQTLVYDWVCQQQFKGGQFELKDVTTEGIGTWPRLVRENDLFIEICGLSLTYKGGLKVSDFYHQVKIKALKGIIKLDQIKIYPKSVRFKQKNVYTHKMYLDNISMLKEFLKQLKGYFDFIDPYLNSLNSLNNLLNYNTNIQLDRDQSISPVHLAVAKLVNDPEYESIYENQFNISKEKFGEEHFQKYYGFLSQIHPVENI